MRAAAEVRRLSGSTVAPRRSTPLGSAPRGIGLHEFTAIVTTAALFGIAAETALAHFGLDIPAVAVALRHASASLAQLSLSWWSLWAAGWVAFLIGRRGAAWAATRLKLKLKVGTGVLAFVVFASAAQLEPGPSGLGIGTTTLFRGAAPLATTALALWGFAATRRRRGQSAWTALHEPFETVIAVSSGKAVRPESRDRPPLGPTERDRADFQLASEILAQLPRTEFRTLGL